VGILSYIDLALPKYRKERKIMDSKDAGMSQQGESPISFISTWSISYVSEEWFVAYRRRAIRFKWLLQELAFLLEESVRATIM
jgi:hypothetical protein